MTDKLQTVEYSRWQNLMSRMQFTHETTSETYQALVAAYSEQHRYYHNLQHIAAALLHFEQARAAINLPDDRANEIELALWFHDAIYKPFSATNERDSADWASRFLIINQADVALVERVDQLIMATLHTAQYDTPEQQLLVDVDLSILGAADKVYDEFEANVRREYRWVPNLIFKRKRKALLKSFLNRARVYQTDFFHDLYEEKARDNLNRAVSRL